MSKFIETIEIPEIDTTEICRDEMPEISEEQIAAIAEQVIESATLDPSEMTVSELVKAVQKGDPECFGSLYTMYKRLIFRICYNKLCRNGHQNPDVEDVVQDTFLSALEALLEAKFKNESKFKTWLVRIAFNEIGMHFRRASNRSERRVSLDTGSETGGSIDFPAGELGIPWDSPFIQAHSRAKLREAISKSLHLTYLVPFLLHEVEGWECQEVAGKLKLSLGAVKGRASRATAMVVDYLIQPGAQGERSPRGRIATAMPAAEVLKALNWAVEAGYLEQATYQVIVQEHSLSKTEQQKESACVR